MEAAAILRRYQILFFGMDWDLKPEINIHTLHRTEHLVAIYFKGRITFSTRRWGRGWWWKLGVCEFLVLKTELSQCWLMALMGKNEDCW